MHPRFLRSGGVRAALGPLALAAMTGASVIAVIWQSKFGEGFDGTLFLGAFVIGLAAQLVDGALGMAYGITATTFLLAGGATPLAATASVHVAEIFTTGASGLAHWRLGNVDRRLFRQLIIPGVIGAVVGAWVVSRIDSAALRPWVSGYLLVMGIYIAGKAFRAVSFVRGTNGRKLVPLAFTGALVDSIGGGGWGPIVATSLLGTGHEPRKTIGTVNAAEFFITLASGFSFVLLAGITHWEQVAGLVTGGLVVAPFAAYLTTRLPSRWLLLFVGVLVALLSAFGLIQALG